MSTGMHMQEDKALGSEAELFLLTDAATAEAWFPKLWAAIRTFEQQFSRFKHDSELTRFNDRAGERVPISKPFENILRRAQDFGALTNGTFNPFILPRLQRAGYVRSMTSPDLPAPDFSSRKVVPYDELRVSDGWAQIPPDTAIDLGGIGKGYLADELGAMLVAAGIPDFSISMGGDIYVSGTNIDGEPWVVDVESPEGTDAITYSRTAPFGIATSGTTRAKLRRTQDHLIDPATGAIVPSSMNLCTIVAHDATSADVLASCVLIKGEAFLRHLFDTKAIYGALFQRHGMAPLVLGEGFSYDR